MDSCLIFHGPGARQRAVDEAGRLGVLLHDPFGDDGLKVDDAREFVSLLQTAPLGDELGVVIAGPMDLAAPKSADVLLKCIEQFNRYVRPILWATDLGGVQATILSRCLSVWSPATGFEPVDEDLERVARELLNATLDGQVYEIPRLVSQIKDRIALLGEVADAMAAQASTPKVLSLWERVREVARWKNPTQLEVIAAFLPET